MPDVGLTFARPTVLWLLGALPLFLLLGRSLGRRRGMPRAALWLRTLVILLLVVTLAEPLLTGGGGATSTVFVVDRSRSLTGTSASQAHAWVNEALAAADTADRAAVVTFGASPVLAAPAGQAIDMGGAWEDVPLPDQGAEYTDIASGLALARALPLGGARRIVLLSDGAENVGTALEQAGQAAADGTPIDVVPLEGVAAGDLRVEGANAPALTWQNEPFTVLASVSTGTGGTGSVELWVDGQWRETRPVTFPPGRSSYAFPVADLAPGFHTVDVRVLGTDVADAHPENNNAPLAVVVRDKPKLLLVAPEGIDPDFLRSALERKGAVITAMPPAKVPSRLSEISAFDAVILDNVPADALTLDQHAGLQEAARSLGRGLIVIGGTSSYGPGGYGGSPLEEALPVTVKVTDGRQRQRVALLLIMDKSGSMSYDPLGGTSKIDMAKEAVRQAAQSLAVGDQVGILVFSDTQQWALPMMTIESEADRANIDAAVASITADGGTEIHPALSVGFDAIRNVDADVRHIVLLTDGKSRTGSRESYQRLIDDVIGDRTTLSSIAIGNDADQELLQFLADEGNGRYHFTDRSEEIPQLALEEAQSAGSQSVLRGNFRPIQTQPSPILLGFDPEELPNLDGYAFAEEKPDAQVDIRSDRDDPILSKWQYGLGRVVAWTADDGADFAAAWPTWQRYDEFWAGMVRWALPDPENRPIQVSVERDGPEALVTVDAVGEQGDFVDLARTTATITTPGGAVDAERELYQTGPGRYQLRVAAPEPGAYKVELRQARGNETVSELAGFAVPPSPELQPVPGADALLRAIAARTGGRMLSPEGADQAFTGGGLTGEALRTYRPLWPWPLGIALLVLLVEIAVRMRFLPRPPRLARA